jgi:hypothetical protein
VSLASSANRRVKSASSNRRHANGPDVSLDAPERQFVDFCALRALLDLCWDCTLWVALTADRERRARLGVAGFEPFNFDRYWLVLTDR